MGDSAQENWIILRNISGCKDPTISMLGRERICVFLWATNLNKSPKNTYNLLYSSKIKKLCKKKTKTLRFGIGWKSNTM